MQKRVFSCISKVYRFQFRIIWSDTSCIYLQKAVCIVISWVIVKFAHFLYSSTVMTAEIFLSSLLLYKSCIQNRSWYTEQKVYYYSAFWYNLNIEWIFSGVCSSSKIADVMRPKCKMMIMILYNFSNPPLFIFWEKRFKIIYRNDKKLRYSFLRHWK